VGIIFRCDEFSTTPTLVSLQQHVSDGARHRHQDLELLPLQPHQGVSRQADASPAPHHREPPVAYSAVRLHDLRQQVGARGRLQLVTVLCHALFSTKGKGKGSHARARA